MTNKDLFPYRFKYKVQSTLKLRKNNLEIPLASLVLKQA
jgi:hypothetical protein